MRTCLARAGCQSDLIEKIIGHGSRSLSQTYTDSVVADLRAEYAKSLDLNRLLTRTATNGQYLAAKSTVNILSEEEKKRMYEELKKELRMGLITNLFG